MASETQQRYAISANGGGMRAAAGRLLITAGARLIGHTAPPQEVDRAAFARGSTQLAVLIDADNAPPTKIGAVLAAVTHRYGVAHIKRAYGDWSRPHLSGWKHPILAYSIRPMHHFAWSIGKNASDLAMAVDAVDLLWAHNLSAVVLVSSDADFTGVAMRVRESGCQVYGFGELKTPQPFVAACDEFTHIEHLAALVVDDRPQQPQNPKTQPKLKTSATSDALRIPPEIATRLRQAVDDSADADGWAHLGAVGHALATRYPDFTPKAYGHTKFGKFIKASTLFEIQNRSPGVGKQKVTYVRNKPT
ncbi:NYN domain-containing protein [Nocardia sp. CA-120079]|uniref:NYN domain-containing protein n=1 Tax=Nocardia sp. CA-120079 TaxID=3239974 RepID=UPI003D978593